MLPVVALIGRPNVGKSTLFNAMTGTRDALVADLPGLTRDRQYGFCRRTEVPCIVVDTGGLVENAGMIESLMVAQTERAIVEADRIVMLVDGRAGVTPQDQFVSQLARRSGKPVLLAVNKTEGFDHDVAVADFHQLGLGEPHPIAAAHDQGVLSLLEATLAGLTPDPQDGPEMTGIKVAVIGRPNVGKSTLINRLLGENRMVTFDQPGTTRDSVLVPFERDGERYTLIDTAGVRRRSRGRSSSPAAPSVRSGARLLRFTCPSERTSGLGIFVRSSLPPSLGLKRMVVLISNWTVVRIFFISLEMFACSRKSRISLATTRKRPFLASSTCCRM